MKIRNIKRHIDCEKVIHCDERSKLQWLRVSQRGRQHRRLHDDLLHDGQHILLSREHRAVEGEVPEEAAPSSACKGSAIHDRHADRHSDT
jgi:hypothetical protein